ncbi:ArsR family transcriptional regulator [Hafnia paralvei ATCC 29927]|jgi:DNA-binding transcriptional ArsR family regulator|uniref:Transcriptional regulator n=1 Tax=Hafnia paralvei TaxID=546367 RepID=A0A2A2MGB2_9GAMM|nr:metalloregulator ArsR/SmtB family transcription factor [Hafnia paralvei]EFV41809.1 hypothetical protein HMPREF0864_00138 [Enterobacteriaceae bacterium 9_2_54FAA]MDU1191829.1 metalloregulator ArsR/SmtB family transcription factor [Enterobacteriaceae bacterium]AMH20110.1 transcriptional regulator [Hafnia paralvei]KHS46389.1 transcriptional regulator [Hafnia paralvei]MBU2674526.1 helix-turn-helix transcriptional regulator [Hafnia paralvei]
MDSPFNLAELQQRASLASSLLKSMSNESRLLILCILLGAERTGAGELAAAVGLSPSATSQHLARMREEGLVDSERVGTSVLYSIKNPAVERVIGVLKDIYCS